MRILKIVLWIAVIFLLETVFTRIIGIRGILPDLLLAFTVAFALRERSLAAVVYIMLICGVLSGSMLGRSFPACVLAAACAGLAARSLRSSIKFVPVWLKNAVLMLFTSFLLSSAEYLFAYGTITPGGLFFSILPFTAYTTAASCAVYPLVKRVFCKDAEVSELLMM